MEDETSNAREARRRSDVSLTLNRVKSNAAFAVAFRAFRASPFSLNLKFQSARARASSGSCSDPRDPLANLPFTRARAGSFPGFPRVLACLSCEHRCPRFFFYFQQINYRSQRAPAISSRGVTRSTFLPRPPARVCLVNALSRLSVAFSSELVRNDLRTSYSASADDRR